MDALILHLEAPLMSFGGPQVDQIGPTGRFPTLSQVAGLLANALGHDHRDWAWTQALQDRLALASLLLRAGRELPDYQTVDLGQEHLVRPGWTTRGRVEKRRGGEASEGTHIRFRRYRADASVLAAVTLAAAADGPTLADLARALDRPARPLFLGRKPCLPAGPVLVGVIESLVEGAAGLEAALAQVPQRFPDRWAAMTRTEPDTAGRFPVELPATDAGEADPRLERVVDQRDWQNGLHGGERVVLRTRLALGGPPHSGEVLTGEALP
ncbi:MAG: type I-E CRISPR-associated protein Cas5/CasD [Alphaproteobacteria bacterium]|nr:type I-E CRISPR-associated protein Cas5/CasD [Alphaproteobacteria bacterium]